MKRLVSLVPLLFLFEENTTFLPSGENIGNASNIPSKVIRSTSFPSRSTIHKLKGLALEDERVKAYTDGRSIRKVIVVPDKLVNVVLGG